MLRVLGNLLDIPGFAYDSSEQIRDEIIPSDTSFVTCLDNAVSGIALLTATHADGLQRIADVPIYFADPLVRRGVALQLTNDAFPPQARMSAETLNGLSIAEGSKVLVRQGGAEVLLTARVDGAVPDACVRVAAAHPLTAALGDMFGPIQVERA